MKTIGHEMTAAQTADEFARYMKRNRFDKIDRLEHVRKHLDGISLRQGYELAGFRVGDMDGHCQTYIRRKGAREIWDHETPYKETQRIDGPVSFGEVQLVPSNTLCYFDVPMTVRGIVHAWCLDNMFYFLPLYWHANYERRRFIFKKADVTYIFKPDSNGSNSEAYLKAREQVLALDRNLLLPKVTITDPFHAQFEYHYCNDWSGLVRCTCDLILFDDKATFLPEKLEKVVPFNCGVIY